MNIQELEMVALLKDLRDNYNVVEVKTEFEDEAARLNEIMRLKDVVEKVGLGLIIKIGGPEAVRDMYDAYIVWVTGIVAPMVESAYALKKYLSAINTFIPQDVSLYIKFAVNIETIQAFQNLDEMFITKGLERLGRITIGRVDLSGSMGLHRDDINCQQVFEITREVCQKARRIGLETTLGGGIARESIPFIRRLWEDRLLDRFETRKIVFKVQETFDEAIIERGIVRANCFELLWLENKRKYYTRIANEDVERIKMLRSRVDETFQV